MANKSNIPAFVSQKRGVVLYLVFYAIAAVIFFYVYHPLGMFNENHAMPIDPSEYVLILLVISYVVLVVSRVLLLEATQRHPNWTFFNVLMWVFVEYWVVVLIVSGMGILIGNNESISFLRMLLRVIVDQVGLYMIPMMIVALISVTLESSNNLIEVSKSYEDLKGQAQQLTEELQAARAQNEERLHEALSLREQLRSAQASSTTPQPSVVSHDASDAGFSDMLRFKTRTGDFDFALPRENVLYLETVDNYVSVNYLDGGRVNTRIIRNTMKSMEEQLLPEGFVRCQRQYLVNRQNIKLVSKERDGIVVHLKGCDRQLPVGKTYAAQLV